MFIVMDMRAESVEIAIADDFELVGAGSPIFWRMVGKESPFAGVTVSGSILLPSII